MALQLGALRDALREAGASEELARAAAEEVAAYENRLVGIDQSVTALRGELSQAVAVLRGELSQSVADLRGEISRSVADLRAEIAGLRAYVDQQLTELRGELRMLRWMNATTLGLVIAVLVKLFVH